MAPVKTKDTPDQVTEPEQTEQTEPTGQTKQAFDWTEMVAPIASATKSSVIGRKVDVLAEVPEPIRQRIEVSLMKTVARIAAKKGSTAKRVRIEPYWTIQPVASQEMGDEFAKLATKYGKYRPAEGDIPHADADSPKGQITVRCGKVTRYRQTDDGPVADENADADGSFLGVRFSARPFEARKDTAKVPGTTS